MSTGSELIERIAAGAADDALTRLYCDPAVIPEQRERYVGIDPPPRRRIPRRG